MKLAETMDAMHALLRGETTPAEAARRLGVPRSRLEAYRRFVMGHVEGALRKNYEVLADLLAPETWNELTARYFRAHPARSFDLNDAGAGFRAFLGREREAGNATVTGFLLDLAEVQWQEWIAWSNPAEIPPPAAGSLVVNPTLVVLDLEWPVSEFLAAVRGSGPTPPPPPSEPAPERVLVYREPERHLAVTRRADDGLLFALKVAHDGLSPEAAAAASGLPPERVREILRRAIDAGVVIG